ncbi:MAG: hypothetical protein KJ067_20730 [Vicinamibacteria bacterium]|nr:hypothetical protein [Vicinamibacteria bacterium]
MSEGPPPVVTALPGPRPERDVRSGSEFLRGQMRQWMEQVEESGRTKELFELEMWLRAFERFFRIKNQPLSEKEQTQLALRNWSEELRLVDNVLLRVMQLCAAILTQEQVDQERFGKFLDGYLKKDEVVDPYIEKLLRQSTPEAELALLRESFEDIHVLLAELSKLARIPYTAFSAVGKGLYREIRRSHLLALLIDKKFKPVHDRISNQSVAAVIRGIESPAERRHAAKVFLELFRLLHYLDYADPQRLSDEELRNSILIFALITSEARLLTAYLERKVLKAMDAERPFVQLCDSLVYCLPLELKKVINTELVDLSAARQSEAVRARVENSHGILRDAFQQSIVQLAQAFDPAVDGRAIFDDFKAKLEQSQALRDGLARVIRALREFQAGKDEASAARMREEISWFYDHQMKHLMYRDWSGFELFFIEILKCASLTGLQQIAHRFDAFLSTLHREVSKRAILQGVPAAIELEAGRGA